MSLQRTPSGLANLHLFFGVDQIIYCEGGTPLSEQEVALGGGDGDTLDVCYWQAIFKNFGSNTSAHFKSVGSKQTLLALALTIGEHNIKNVIVCLDRDHDDMLGKQIHGNRILYTFGYSWENDVLCSELLESLFFRFRNRNPDSEAAYHRVQRSLEAFLLKSQKYCACDVYFISKGIGGMFRRDAPVSAVLISQNAPPDLNEPLLRGRLAQLGYKRLPVTRYRVSSADVALRLFGKLFGRFVYHLMWFFARPKVGQFVNYEMFMRAAITRFDDSLRGGNLPEIRAYYAPIVP